MNKNKTYLMIIIIFTTLLLFTVGYSAWIIVSVKDSTDSLEYNYRDIVINAFKDQSGDYNGNPQGPVPKYNGTYNAELIDSEDFTYSYRKIGTEVVHEDDLPIDAGTYDIFIKSDYFSESDEDIIVQYTINKISPVIPKDSYSMQVFISNTSWDIKQLYEVDKDYEGEINIVYNTIDGNKPNQVGNYTATVSFTEFGNFKSDTIIIDIEIKDEIDVNPDLIELNVITYPEYTGEKITLSKDNIEVKIDGSVISSEYFEIDGYLNNINAGENTANVTIKLINGYAEVKKTGTFTILPRELKPLPLEIDYNSDNRTFDKIVKNLILIAENGLMLCGVNDSTITMSAVGMVSILNMHNGQYGYGEFLPGETYYETTTNVIGSTYLVKVQYISSDTNYIINNKNSFILKYKTAFTTIDGTPSWCTIEDAINLGTGTITFAGNSSGAATYVQTAFSKLNANHTGYTDSFDVIGRTLIVPFSDDAKTKLTAGTLIADDLIVENSSNNLVKTFFDTDQSSDGNVFAALNIPQGITINFQNKSSLIAAADIAYKQNTATTNARTRGVIINHGTINIDSTSILASMGYIKGGYIIENDKEKSIGEIVAESGSMVYDCLNIYDWVGGKNALSLINKVFLTNSWTSHHLSCKITLKSGSFYKVLSYMMMSKIIGSGYEKAISWGTIIGSIDSDNCVFKPKDNSSYIVKETTKAHLWTYDHDSSKELYSIVGHNRLIGQRDKYTLYGSYNDSAFSLNVQTIGTTVPMNTTKELGLPVAYMDIILAEGGYLGLENSDYTIFPGCQIIISDGATLYVDSGVDIAMLDWNTVSTLLFGTKYCVDKNDAVLIINGIVKGSGSFGGLIKSTTEGVNLSLSDNTAEYVILKALDTRVSDEVSAKGPLYTSTNIYSEKLLDNTTYYFGEYAWCLANGSITYDVNGGDTIDISPTQVSFVNGTNIGYTISGSDLTDIIPTKVGHTFVDWYLYIDELDSSKDIIARGQEIYANTILYAKWVTNKYTITFDTDGADNIDPIEVYYGTEIEWPVKPQKDGAEFVGWEEDGEIVTYVNMPAKDLNLKAKWVEEAYTITFDSNGGSTIKELSYEANATIIWDSRAEPIKDGYKFKGWDYDNDGVDDRDTLTIMPSEDITVIAIWAELYTITYNSGGGNLDKTSEDVEANNSISLPTPTRTGYKFLGWYTASSGGTKIGDAGATYTPTSDVTLYAQWTGFVVEYNPNEGSCSTASQTYAGTALILPTPTRNNYKCTGWYTASSGGTKIGDAGATYTPTSDVTLYAQWEYNGICIGAGTLVTMSDGTQKLVEELVAGDIVLIFNHETGQIEPIEIMYNAHDDIEWQYYDVINLEFSDGTILKVINEHAVFDTTLNRYVFINENTMYDYLGHTFYKMSIVDGQNIRSDVTLEKVYMTNEYTGIYNPVSYYHLNFFGNGLLTTAGSIEKLINNFEYDYDLKYNEESYKENIEKYGIYTYEELSEYYSEEVYNSIPVQYVKIAVGKGIITWEEAKAIIDEQVKAIEEYYKNKES